MSSGNLIENNFISNASEIIEEHISDEQFGVSELAHEMNMSRSNLLRIVAVLTLIPAYKVIFLYSRGLPQEAWYTYFHLFHRAGGDMGFFADNPVQNWLWFLPVLFVFQIVYLGLSKTRLLSMKISLMTGVILTFAAGLIYCMVISGFDLTGWYHSALLHFQRERLVVYFMAFLLGSLCNKLQVFDSEKRNRKLFIWSNVVLAFSLILFTAVALNLFFNMIDPGRNYFFVSPTFDRGLYYLSSLLSMFCFLSVFIHLFRFNFNKSNRLLGQLSRNSYHVYIIHVIVTGVIALILLNVSMPVMVKFLILVTATYIVSNFIVYGFSGIFQRAISMKSALATALITILVIVAFYGKSWISADRKIDPVSETTSTIPVMGLHKAALTGNVEAIQQHINAGSDLDQQEPSRGSSPLITAATFGKTEVALLLIEGGAEVNFTNKDGSTPLHTAAFFCQTEIVEALLKNGAKSTMKNNSGSTPLQSVDAPFETVKGIYDYFGNILGPLGLELDYEQIKATRPIIAKMLQKENANK